MRDVMPWIEQADIPAARASAEMEYLADQVYAVLRAMHPVKPEGEARRLLDDSQDNASRRPCSLASLA